MKSVYYGAPDTTPGCVVLEAFEAAEINPGLRPQALDFEDGPLVRT